MATHFDQTTVPLDDPNQAAMVAAGQALVEAAKAAVMSGPDAITGDDLVQLQMSIIGNGILQVIGATQVITNAPIPTQPLFQCMVDIVGMGKPLGSEATLN